ncbi:MAG: non-homologous end-joining DNA ligase [Solirubrobacteraceae bacterium]
MSEPASVRAGRRVIEITHPERVMFSQAGLTKLDLARYYGRVATAMVPHTRDRPVTMQTFPGGAGGDGYVIKQAPRHFPMWIARARMEKKGGSVEHVLANDAGTLVYLAGQNVITPHVWPARADRPDRPDRLIFDLDPPAGTRFAEVRAVARSLGDALRDLGLEPFAMTTGSRGVHVVVPLRRTSSWAQTRAFARTMANRLVGENRSALTTARYKSQRRGRIFVDTGRTTYAHHAAAPYAVRPRPNAPVATPLRWEELEDRRLDPQGWTIQTLPRRLESEGDPWRGIGRHSRALGRAAARLG